MRVADIANPVAGRVNNCLDVPVSIVFPGGCLVQCIRFRAFVAGGVVRVTLCTAQRISLAKQQSVAVITLDSSPGVIGMRDGCGVVGEIVSVTCRLAHRIGHTLQPAISVVSRYCLNVTARVSAFAEVVTRIVFVSHWHADIGQLDRREIAQ